MGKDCKDRIMVATSPRVWGNWELGAGGCNCERDWKRQPLMCSSGFGWWAGLPAALLAPLLDVRLADPAALLLAFLPDFPPAVAQILLVLSRLAVALGVAPKLPRVRWLRYREPFVSKWWWIFRGHVWVREFWGLDAKPVQRTGRRIRTPHGRRCGNGRGRRGWGCGTRSTSTCTWLLNCGVGCCREERRVGCWREGCNEGPVALENRLSDDSGVWQIRGCSSRGCTPDNNDCRTRQFWTVFEIEE